MPKSNNTPTPLDIAPLQETLHDDYCGLTSLKIVPAYFGVEKDEE